MLPKSAGSIPHLTSESALPATVAVRVTDSPSEITVLSALISSGRGDGGEPAGVEDSEVDEGETGVDCLGVPVAGLPPSAAWLAGSGAGISEIVELADFLLSAKLVAVTVTVVFEGIAGGAVYKPSLVTVPCSFGSTFHSTPLSSSFVTPDT